MSKEISQIINELFQEVYKDFYFYDTKKFEVDDFKRDELILKHRKFLWNLNITDNKFEILINSKFFIENTMSIKLK